MSNLKRFISFFERHPYISQASISGVLQFSGDFITQKFIEKKEKLDRKRSMNFLILGCLTGVSLRRWYGFLDRKFTDPRRSFNAAKKVAGVFDYYLKLRMGRVIVLNIAVKTVDKEPGL